MAFYYSRRKLKVREPDEVGELNVVPYLDVLMNLIMFMLLSITGLATFGILNVNSPSFDSAPATAQQSEASDQPNLLLTVMITNKGFVVATTGTVLGGKASGEPTIPKLGDGRYDFAALTAQMERIKAAEPRETRAFVGAEGEISYDVLIHTMDAIRNVPGQPNQLLFPDVTLAAM